jgi:hypothetical protein
MQKTEHAGNMQKKNLEIGKKKKNRKPETKKICRN